MSRLALIPLLSLGMGILRATALAATFAVTSTLDAVDANPGDGVCETAPGNGTCTLRAAVQETNALGGSNTILLPAGTYTLTIPGAGEDLAATGDLDITSDLTVTGADRSTTIIDGNRLDRVFHVVQLTANLPPSLTFSLSHVTVRNGMASDGAAIASYSQVPLALSDCTITENDGNSAVYSRYPFTMSDSEVSRNSGAGLFSPAGAVVTNTVVSGNAGTGMVLGFGGPGGFGGFEITLQAVTVTANGNGGISVQSAASPTTLIDSLIADNRGVGINGGSNFCALVLVARTRVLRNSAGIVVGTDCAVSCTDCVIADNAPGGGVSSVGAMALTDCSVTGNTGTGGGGVRYRGAGSLTLRGVTISNNHATSDGGGVWINSPDGPAIIERTTISGNSAAGSGGGLFEQEGRSLLIRNSTIAGNKANTSGSMGGSGGGIANISTFTPVTLENLIVAGNSDGSGGAPDCAGELVSNGHNLIQSLAGCSLTGDLATSIFGHDPLLGPLADNGGPTFTRALLAGSPAVDVGPATCGDVDQRGVSRPQLAACDIGAYEFACGNGVVDLGEQCDPGSGPGGACCSPDCQVVPAPIVLPATGGTFTGTTTGARALLTGTCVATRAAPEVVYQWTPAVSGSATIQTCSATQTTFDTVLYLREGACVSGSEVACNDDTRGCGDTLDVNNPFHGSRITPTVTAGQTYFIVVDGYATSRGSFALTVTPPSGQPLPAACSAPIPLPAAGGTFLGVTSGTSTLAGSCSSSKKAPEVVYQWTPTTSGAAVIETCSATQTTFDTILYLRQGDCASGSEIACNDDTPGCGDTRDTSNPFHGSRLTPTVTAGQTYFIVVDGYATSRGSFALTVIPPPAAPLPTACDAPIPLPAAGGTFLGATSGASTLAGSCSSPNAAPEVVYQWTPTVSGTATIQTCSATQTTFDTVLYLREGACLSGSEVACNDDTRGCGTTRDTSNPFHGSHLTPTVTAGQTYFIVVDGYATSKGTFALSIAPPP